MHSWCHDSPRDRSFFLSTIHHLRSSNKEVVDRFVYTDSGISIIVQHRTLVLRESNTSESWIDRRLTPWKKDSFELLSGHLLVQILKFSVWRSRRVLFVGKCHFYGLLTALKRSYQWFSTNRPFNRIGGEHDSETRRGTCIVRFRGSVTFHVREQAYTSVVFTAELLDICDQNRSNNNSPVTRNIREVHSTLRLSINSSYAYSRGSLTRDLNTIGTTIDNTNHRCKTIKILSVHRIRQCTVRFI